MKTAMRVFVCLLLSITTGCASMFNGTRQRINVRSEVKGTHLYLNGEEIGTDSASVQIAKKNLSDSVLTAKKEGCSDAQASINTTFDATSLLGVIIDLGIVSILVVDWGITGAVHEAERTNYVLNPICEQH